MVRINTRAGLAEVSYRGLESESSSYNKSAFTNKMVVDWILDHIKKVDMELGAFIAEKSKV